MAISNTLQRVGFTSELYLLYGALQSVDLQVKNTCKGGKVGAITVSKGKQEAGISMTATPNPFNSSLTVTFKGAEEATQTKGNLSLIDTNGKTIMTQKITNLTIPVRLDTKSYSSGSYLLTMQGADGTLQTTQLVKIN